MKFEIMNTNIGAILENADQNLYHYPVIQRPFVWNPEDICMLIDSVYKGYPINSIFIWQQAGQRLRDGSTSKENSLLVIDGQQRITSLTCALLGKPYLTESLETVDVRIAFDPIAAKFAVSNETLKADPRWYEDISKLHDAPAVWKEYQERPRLPETYKSRETDFVSNIRKLRNLIGYQIGVYKLKMDSPEEVSECFRRANQLGQKVFHKEICLTQLETHYPNIAETTVLFSQGIRNLHGKEAARKPSEDYKQHALWKHIQWATNGIDNTAHIYKPDSYYTAHMMFALVFNSSNFRDFSKKLLYPKDKAKLEQQLESALKRVVDQDAYMHFNSILAPMHQVENPKRKIVAQWIYLWLRDSGDYTDSQIQNYLRRWYLLSLCGKNFSGSDMAFKRTMRSVRKDGIEKYLASLESEAKRYFDNDLEEELTTPKAKTPWWLWQAVQGIAGDTALFDSDVSLSAPGCYKFELAPHLPRKHSNQRRSECCCKLCANNSRSQ